MIFHKDALKLLIVLFTIALILSSCSRNVISEKNPVIQQQVKIDWTDFLKINATSYTGSQEKALTDPSKLGEEIGKVTFHVADVVNDPHYIPKDGDAALLAVGSVVRAIADYPNHEIVAVQNKNSIGGYKIYVEDSKQKELRLSFEEAVQSNKVTEIAIYPMNNKQKLIVKLDNGQEQSLISMLQRAAKEQIHPDKAAVVEPIYYQFVMNSGSAIGYVDTFYKADNYYYWYHPEANQLQSAFANFFPE
ncbi:hypothetical protein EHS13_09295 [Paenibacillus psychroresistens]|uniref:Uncharacterized protein n=1 Tax=Paenibacillus psychroresistens TaxID=1778678 RepID=A0A6B8RHQ1_9BACL|nr:hypothetical protein [Paenibacillus psychroresistens]QGQ95063.1 hypothetical protein EHS13_09295 [Paenibacillus psychroresistens]